jgi:hypothetical protein
MGAGHKYQTMKLVTSWQNKSLKVRLEVFSVMKIQTMVLWAVTPRGDVVKLSLCFN